MSGHNILFKLQGDLSRNPSNPFSTTKPSMLMAIAISPGSKFHNSLSSEEVSVLNVSAHELFLEVHVKEAVS